MNEIANDTTQETKRERKLFWPWQDEQEESWLTAMAQQGWHLVKPGLFGSYTFERGAPRNVAYRLDFQASTQDQEAYLQLFADAGWEHLGEMGGWHYFRKEAEAGETPEIYTDTASKIAKYRRVMMYLVVFLPLYIVFLGSSDEDPATIMQVADFILIGLLLFQSYLVIRLYARIQELKKQP